MTRLLLSALITLGMLGGVSRAQEVGSVAAARGEAEIGRGGAFGPAAVGDAVQLGDELRTGDGQLRVVFRDDSVIDLSERSSLVVDQQVFDPDASRFTSLVRLVAGQARALESHYYGTPGASYEVQTPTAVAGVRGTTFLVSYDPDRDATDVIGIHGRVEVRSLTERLNDTVYVSAAEGTTVLRGMVPTPPEPIGQDYLRYEDEALQPLAVGGVGRLAATSSVQTGSTVPAPDRAPSSSGLAGQIGRDELRNPGDVAGQPLGAGGRGRLGVPF